MKYINFAGMAVGDMLYLDLACMINSEKVNNERFCMTIETFKNMHEAMSKTIQQYDAAMAEKRKAN